jgi:peptide/nickel transport system substrate-binding protein
MSQQKKNPKKIYAVAAVIIVAILAVTSLYLVPMQQGGVMTTGVTTSGAQTTAPQEKLWVTEADVSSTGKADPATGTDLPAFRIYVNAYDSLVTYDFSSPAQIIPSLATSWTVSSDNLVYTFVLRQGVKFHDGSVFNASAVKYSMDRMMTMQQGVSFMWQGRLKPGSTEVVDDHTVRFRLDKPFAPFIGTLAYFMILSPTTVNAHLAADGPYGDMKDYGTTWLSAGNDAGCGPYKITVFKSEERIEMERFDDYWRGWKPNQFYGFRFLPIQEEGTIKQLVIAGQVQLRNEFSSPQFVQWADKFDGTKVSRGTANLQPNYIYFNTMNPPFDDVWFRKGMSELFDYQTFLTEVRGDIGDKALVGPMPAAYWGHNDSIKPYDFNITKAKEYFAKSKYSDLSAVRELTFNYINQIEFERLQGLLLQSNAAKVGLKIKVESLPWAQYSARVGDPATAPDMVSVTNQGFYAPDPDAILYTLWHSTSTHTWSTAPTYYSNARVDELLDQGRIVTDQAQRAKMYEEVQGIINDAAPVIFAMEQVTAIPHSVHLFGVSPNVAYLHTLGAYWMTWQGAPPPPPVIISPILTAQTAASTDAKVATAATPSLKLLDVLPQ